MVKSKKKCIGRLLSGITLGFVSISSDLTGQFTPITHIKLTLKSGGT